MIINGIAVLPEAGGDTGRVSKHFAGNAALYQKLQAPLFAACSNTGSLQWTQDYERAAGSYGKRKSVYDKLITVLSEEG